MLTQNEITALSLSPTKKDFVQIWNELLDVAGKLSERWDPTSTNESDPGIVLLKALTGIADKLNYTIDKNILEAFMPTAAQEDSMRKLCDMLGYNMKYYRSAETDVTIRYYNPDPDDKEAEAMSNANTGHGQVLPKFTVITNSDKDISYFTTSQSSYIHPTKSPSTTVPCMEGQIVKCESSNDNNVITANQISENNRFYLPETMIAENGIFIYNVTIEGNYALADGEPWTRVENLNTQSRDARVFKFGYDSYESRPYVEFPDDYSKLFNDGIFLYYTRTSGVNGNVSPRTLTQIELPSNSSWSDVKASSFSVENIASATSGANAETIKQAYNNFKKTVGTFETLVTCRDYMNKIYSFIVNGKPLVSNILVTDIRNDLNRAVTICSCDDAGIFYKEVPLSSNIPVSENTKPVFGSGSWHLGSADGIALPNSFVKDDSSPFDYTKPGEAFVKAGYWYVRQENNKGENITYKTVLQVGRTEQAINHFDIVFYPYKSYNQIRSNVKDIRAVYDASFKYSEANFGTIKQLLDDKDIKTISHNIKTPDVGDILSINNYLRLSATIATNAKVTADEGAIIIDKIKIALANAFNMRELDFGDEIPFDSIVEVIENADTRIKVASLNEPALYTTFSVLEGRGDNNVPTVVEYAVASDWLDVSTADKTDRLIKTIHEKNSEGELVEKTVSTFDTVEARKIYNKLAVRNVLAGRVPLFNYNGSFTSSFSESAYQVTNIPNGAIIAPDYINELYGDNTYKIWTENGTIYTEQKNAEGKSVFTETSTPTQYTDNIVAESISDNRVDNYITDIKADCKLIADESGVITDVTLADGEFVKFRAPNFVTVKTYPAYVNYHLDLSGEEETEAKAAGAESLLNILNADLEDYSESNTDIKWQKVLNYFANKYDEDGKPYKKTFRLEQTVSAFKETEEKPATGKVTILGVDLENTQVEVIDYTPEQLMALSGCVKLNLNYNPNFKAHLEWLPEEGADEPAEDLNAKVEIVLSDFKSPFITNINVLSAMKTAVDNALNTYRDKLPRQCAWKVSFEFECVPFEANSLATWIEFIKHCANYPNEQNQILGTKAEGDKNITFWQPVEENGTILWRLFGDGYEVGKYVTKNTEKLLPFNQSYFGLLPAIRLSGVYLVKEIGTDAVPVIIKNNEEYKLRTGERLYIEYTPSTTTEDSTAQATRAITEIHGEGTIIRPSGFEAGLVDSTKLGASTYKTVTFSTTDQGTFSKNMYSLGASEQIEIRDFAQVTITSADFPAIWVYKNFNGCPELENKNGNAEGSRTYTLKDGEAIFYTDQNKAEFAYYTAGTEVTLDGKFTIGEFEVIELATILDSGLQEIPWERKTLNDNDSITFQEYQYITLGSEDTINSLVLIDPKKDAASNYLDDTWKACSDVEYTLASEPDVINTLPKINLQGDSYSNGWEASSTLELNVSQSIAQTLRKTDKVETSITLSRTSTTGGSAGTDTISPVVSYSGTELPLSFKTNLACQACGNEINVKNVWSNPDGLKGFQLKVFAADYPALVKTKPDTIVPYDHTGDITTWIGEPLQEKEYLELWNKVDLEDIEQQANKYDNALRLPISLLPNTYGVFSVYVSYSTTSSAEGAKTWIEVIPGTKVGEIELLNNDNSIVDFLAGTNDTKLHRLYLSQGINCIRVNTNTKVFIKTSSGARGTLHFDELRLVNSLPIKYTDDDIILNTKGLNIAQLGYLDSSDDVKSSLTASAKEKLQEAYVEGLYKNVNELVQQSEEAFTEEYKKLVESLPKVRILVDTEKRIAEELKTIKNLDNARFIELAAKYKEVSETLNKEKTLLEALNGNIEADTLEIKLVDLLDSFTSIEDEQQQILYELSDLRAKAEANLRNISNEYLLADFNDSPSDVGSDKEKALPKIKAEASRMIEADYQEQLATIAGSLDNSINSTGNATLIAIFEKLRNNATAHIRDMLQTKVNELSSIVENDVTTLAEELVDLVYEIDAEAPDYTAFLDRLNELRSIVVSSDIQTLVLEIERAVEETNDQQLKNLLSPLFLADDFNSGDPSVESILNYGTYGLVTEIDTLAGYARANSLASLKGENGIEGIEALASSISTDYKNALINTFKALRDAVVALSSETASLDNILMELTSLANAEDRKDENGNSIASTSQAQIIINQLSSIITERNNLIKAVNELSADNLNDSTCKHLVNKAIIAIWPAYITGRGAKLLDDIADAFVTAFNSVTYNAETDDHAKISAAALYSDETSCMKLLLNTVAIDALFSKTESLNIAIEQRESEIENIEEISSLLLDSDKLVTAINANSTNKVIQELINQWSAANSSNNVKQKQRVQTDLKAALTKAIDRQEQLFAIISAVLCPNLTKASVDIEALAAINETEGFYNELILQMNMLTNKLKNCERSDLTVADDSAYLRLLELPLFDFKTALLNFSVPEASLLPSNFSLTAITERLVTANERANDRTVLENQRLCHLSSVELRTLVVSDNKIQEYLANLCTKVEKLEQLTLIYTDYEDAFKTLKLEDQLLDEIRAIDVNREFYYTAPIPPSFAIDLNESISSQNTLMNPQMNYDINNINNSFVISKLDIDFLDSGIQIARSSRLN